MLTHCSYRRRNFAALVLTAALFGNGLGFFPTAWKEAVFGGGGVSHIEQTDQAFETLAKQYFPFIEDLSRSMVNARDAISQANADVDDDQEHSALHCDGENLDEAQARLQTLHAQVVGSLSNNNAGEAREALGSALHTVQDFYAHSNWIEMGNTAPSDVLGRAATIAHAGPTDQTCKDCIIIEVPVIDPIASPPVLCPDCRNNEEGFLGQLTSGYYFGEDSPANGAPIPDFKCHHGGRTDNPFGGVVGFLLGPVTPGINKDSLNCQFSPHDFAHAAAVDLSIRATMQYIDDIKKEITPSQLRLLFGVGQTLAFCIDTTGSMEDVISAVREQSIAIVSERLGSVDEPSSYVISPFNDPDTGPVVQTADFEAFKTTLQGLTAFGGGDCPELVMSGILNALDVLDEGSILFVFTDADAKDSAYAEQVISIARTKDVSIYVFKFDSDCDDETLRKRTDPSADRIYSSLASGTSGQYHSLPRAQVNDISGIIDTLTLANNGFILKIEQTSTGNATKAYEIPIDSLITELSISLRGTGSNMIVIHPNGSNLSINDTDVSYVVLFDGVFVTIKNPQVGNWSVEVSAFDNYTLEASGKSSLQFSSFVFSELRGRPGHTGYYPINGTPPYNSDIAVVASLQGNFSTVQFEFRRPAGDIITGVPMAAGNGIFGYPPPNTFFTILRLAPVDTYVYVTGLDASGYTYQRVVPSLITPIFSNRTYRVEGLTTEAESNTTTTSSSSSVPITTGTASTVTKSASWHAWTTSRS